MCSTAAKLSSCQISAISDCVYRLLQMRGVLTWIRDACSCYSVIAHHRSWQPRSALLFIKHSFILRASAVFTADTNCFASMVYALHWSTHLQQAANEVVKPDVVWLSPEVQVRRDNSGGQMSQGRRNRSGRPGGCRTNNLTSNNFYVHIISIFEKVSRF